VLRSDEIGRQPVNGTLRIGDTRALMFLLRESLGLNVVEQEGVIFVEAR